jgi:hypothetical protein
VAGAAAGINPAIQAIIKTNGGILPPFYFFANSKSGALLERLSL